MSDKQDSNTERTFLHDIATPLGTAMLFADAVIEDLQEKNPGAEELVQLRELYKALEKMSDFLTKRREFVKKGAPIA